jgi:hypothetical protein
MHDTMRLQESIDLVETIIHQVSTQYTIIDSDRLTEDGLSYKVVVDYQSRRRTLGAFTRGEIVNCTDPDSATAMKYQAYIRTCVQQDLKHLLATF